MEQEIVCKGLNQIYKKLWSKDEFWWNEMIRLPCYRSFLTFRNISGGLCNDTFCSWIIGDLLNPLSANPTIWSNTFKEFVGCCRGTVWVCLTILSGWRLKKLYRSTQGRPVTKQLLVLCLELPKYINIMAGKGFNVFDKCAAKFTPAYTCPLMNKSAPLLSEETVKFTHLAA